jgi:hypothetical protein
LFVWELKGSEGSILDAISQAAATASNNAMALLAKGVPTEECIVPVAGSTGLNMIFGVVIILAPSFPTFVPLSKNLDLEDPDERRVAAAYLELIEVHARQLGKRIDEGEFKKAAVPEVMGLGKEGFYIKTIDRDAFSKGLGMFTADMSHLEIGPGLMHMIEVLNTLHASCARDWVVFPISIRTPDLGTPREEWTPKATESYEILYPDLRLDGFRIGCPNRTDTETFNKYTAALNEAVNQVHAAGVVHGDLYVSNIMWKQNKHGSIIIRIIDWDTAHCLSEGDFQPMVKIGLKSYLGEEPVFSPAHDHLYLAVLTRELIPEEQHLWEDLSSNDKLKVDEAFRTLFRKHHNV